MTLPTYISSPPSHTLPSSPPTTHVLSSLPPDHLAAYEQAVEYYSDPEYRVGRKGLPSGAVGAVTGVHIGDGDEAKLTEDEMIFLSQEGIIRFLIATKYDLQAGLLRIDKCLAWRRAFGCYDVRKMSEECEAESPSGKQFIIGYSTSGQPVLHMLPNRSNTEAGPRQMKHAVYMLERTCDMFPPGVSNLCLIIDFAGKRSAPTSPSQARQFISILQDCYPERLGKAILLSVPWIVKKFLDFAFTFVDPVTKKKVAWNVDIVEEGIVPKEAAIGDYGGDIPFTYDHDDYWPTLLEVCLKRREAYRQAWRQLGGGVGRSEWDFKRAALGSDSAETAETAIVNITSEGTPVSAAVPAGLTVAIDSNEKDQSPRSMNSRAETLLGEDGEVDVKHVDVTEDVRMAQQVSA